MSVTTLPKFTIRIDGVALDLEDVAALSELFVRQRLSRPTQCELCFLDPKGSLAAGNLQMGSHLEVRSSAGRETSTLFDGEITAVEYAHEPSQGRAVRLRGYDRLHRLRKRQPVRVHVEVSLRDLVKELVGAEANSVEVADAWSSDSDPFFPRLFQFRQTDFDLLREVTERSGFYFTLADDELRLLTPDGLNPGGLNPGGLNPGGMGQLRSLELGQGLFEARFELNSEHACGSVRSSGWTIEDAGEQRGLATEPRLGRKISAELSSHSSELSQEWQLLDERLVDSEQADLVAQGELDYRRSQEVVFWGVVDGDPELTVGTRVEVQGVAESFAGDYVLGEVTHTVDRQRGFVTEVSSRLPARQSRPWGTVSALGVVVRVDDPERRGRVQLRLPAYADLETGWLPVVTAGAGPGKGVVALPDVEDRVLVLFAREDPAQAIVLGGLYGSEEAPGETVAKGAVAKVLVATRGQQRILLDDTEESVVIENSDGSGISLTPEKVSFVSSTDLEILAPGKNITIAAQSIHFKKRG